MAVVVTPVGTPLCVVQVTSAAALKQRTMATAAGAFPSANAKSLGVCKWDAASGTAVDLVVLGLIEVNVGAGNVTAGDQVVVVGSVGAVTTGSTEAYVVGVALDTATSGYTTRVLVGAI
jgi:hypothetical protein